jgi:hypothetical protein
MSQMTATARPLRTPRTGPAVVPLRVIPARISTSGNGAFAALCIALLTGGLIMLLLLNTALAQGSLELGKLQSESALLADQSGNLQEEIDRASATGELAKAAARLGMVRSNERGYIDLAKGTVTGTAYPAGSAQAFSVVTSPTPVPKPPKAPQPVKPAATAPPTAKPGATQLAPKPGATQPPAKPGASPKPAASTPKPSPSAQTTQTQTTQQAR